MCPPSLRPCLQGFQRHPYGIANGIFSQNRKSATPMLFVQISYFCLQKIMAMSWQHQFISRKVHTYRTHIFHRCKTLRKIRFWLGRKFAKNRTAGPDSDFWPFISTWVQIAFGHTKKCRVPIKNHSPNNLRYTSNCPNNESQLKQGLFLFSYY